MLVYSQPPTICYLKLLLKNIITPEDWEVMSEHIQYDFLYDNHFTELKESELLNERLGSLEAVQPYVWKYFSQDWVRRKVLRETDQEIIEQDAQIEKEISDGTIPAPATIDPETGLPLMDDPMMGGGEQEMALGEPVASPDLETEVIADKPKSMPKGGEI